MWHMDRDPKVYGENAAHVELDPVQHPDATGDTASGGPSGSSIEEDGHVSYGFSRRVVCVGPHVSIFINIAVLLWASKIERKRDVSGRSLELSSLGRGWVCG